MSVPVGVVVGVSIIGAVLLLTSAVLIYKLRPGRTSSASRKSSGQSNGSTTPVRRLTVVRGMVVEEKLQLPAKGFLPRLSALYTSRRTSIVPSSLPPIQDIEAQPLDNEKLPENRNEERLSFEKSGRSRKVSVKSPTQLVLRDSFFSESSLTSPALSPRSSISKLAQRGSAEENDAVVSALISPPTRSQKPSFNLSALKAASVSAIPPSAFSTRVTPAPSTRSASVDGLDVEKSFLHLTSSSESARSSHEAEVNRADRRPSKELTPISEASTRRTSLLVHSGREPVTPSQSPYSGPRSRSRSRSRSSWTKDKLRDITNQHRSHKRRPTPLNMLSEHLSPGANEAASLGETSDSITQSNEKSSIIKIATPQARDFAPSVKNRPSMDTFASSQYSPTFSLANVQRMPLYAGIVKPSGTKPIPTHSPAPPVPKLSTKPPSSSVMSVRNAPTTGLRKKRMASQDSDTPLLSSSRPSIDASSLLSPAFMAPTSVTPRSRVSRYSHLVDKELPISPATAWVSSKTTSPMKPLPQPNRSPLLSEEALFESRPQTPPDVSPIQTPHKATSKSPASSHRGRPSRDRVSPLSEEFPNELRLQFGPDR